MRVLYIAIVLFSLTVGTAHAGFDFGPVGNGFFWVGLCLWSAGVAWMIYVRRATLGKRMFSLLRTVFAPHKKTQIIVAAPKYRPYVETTHTVDALERAAESFLSATKTGIHHAQNTTRDALAVLEHDTDVALSAVNRQRARMHTHTTSLSDRVRNIKDMIRGTKKYTSKKQHAQTREQQTAPIQNHVAQGNPSQPHSSVLHGTSHDDAAHTRQKVKVLSDAHRALIRARNAQHDLPSGGVYHDDLTIPQHVHSAIAPLQQVQPQEQEIIPLIEPATPPAARFAPEAHEPKKHQNTPSKQVIHETPQSIAQPVKKPEAQSATRDELVLDTSGPVPKLVLTRKTQ